MVPMFDNDWTKNSWKAGFRHSPVLQMPHPTRGGAWAALPSPAHPTQIRYSGPYSSLIEFELCILLDYVELLNHKVRYENGFEINYYNAELFHPYILYNYMSIIKIMGIDFEKELISLKSRKMVETKNNYKYVMYKLWNIEDILKIHNATDCGCWELLCICICIICISIFFIIECDWDYSHHKNKNW